MIDKQKIKELITILVMAVSTIIVVILTFALVYFGNTIAGAGQRVYNCSIAEISPDFTPKMREECRKIRKEQ